MRLWIIALAAALQLLTLAFMAGQRELVLRTGTVVLLRSAPLDPRDLFRGDYVRLNYQVSSVPRSLWRDGLLTAAPRRDQKVYARLRTGASGLAEVESVSDIRPADGTFLRGRVETAWQEALQVRYGLEAYFMQQGKALALEQQRNRDGIQVPLDMDVAVGGSGLAVIRGYRWGDLGLGLDLETQPATKEQRGPREFTGVVTLRLLNASDKPLAVVDLPGGRSFRLRPESQWQQNPWRWVNEGEALPAVTSEHVKLLAPGAIHTVHIDLTDASWFVKVPEKQDARTLRGLQEWHALFRLVYEPPAAEACAGLENAALIWHGSLPSRRFNGQNRID